MEAFMTLQGVEILSVCDLLDEIRPNWLTDFSNRDPQGDDRAIREWCENNGAVYYAAGREYFTHQAAADTAKDAGKTKAVVNNLS